jgi:type IV secretory pathway VirB10-like protein
VCQKESDKKCPEECTKENDPDCWTLTDTMAQLWEGSCTDLNGDTTPQLTERTCIQASNQWDGTTGKMFYVCIGTFFGSLVGMVIFVVLSIQERAEERKAEEQKLDQYKGQPAQESAEQDDARADYPDTGQPPAPPPQESAPQEQPAEQQQSWSNESSEGWSDSEGGW